jgi:hypothetical protein
MVGAMLRCTLRPLRAAQMAPRRAFRSTVVAQGVTKETSQAGDGVNFPKKGDKVRPSPTLHHRPCQHIPSRRSCAQRAPRAAPQVTVHYVSGRERPKHSDAGLPLEGACPWEEPQPCCQPVG